MMSAAGTPSSDPWVIVPRERIRYEEQFRALKPINGIVTGDQAKGFFLQSQLPPMVLGQIWGLADTDADGKMDINEFSIACKLINLKLRGHDTPKVLPPTLLASLAVFAPPAIPPLPASVPPPARPQPPKIPAPIQQPQNQPLIPNLINQAPIVSTGIPTGIVQPMQSAGIIPPLGQGGFATQPMNQSIPTLGMLPQQPLQQGYGVPLVPVVSSASLTSNIPLIPGVMPGSNAMGTNAPLVSGVTAASTGITSPGAVTTVAPAGPSATSTPRASVTSIDRAASVESPLVDWMVPHPTKLKYTQIFNTTDRTRSGYLSGAQARNVMVQTKLPQNLLAQIWALSDMDADGRLGCEEFVLAMHLCEQAAVGVLPPAALPLELIPPSFRRPQRTSSVSSQGTLQSDPDPASTLLSNKRKENFEKGQAELERRRKTLLEQQRKEAEERERKEREEIDRREKARQEAERRRMEELEKQMREQQEQERLKEEERKRQAEQRESARREMERQRQLEWEKQRLQELQQQRQREQESVLKLKAKNQSLTIELSTLNDQVRELSQKICDTRVGVSNVKSTIDGMRSTRDTQMQDMSQLKNKLKEQNAKLLALSQEKVKLDAKNKMNAHLSDVQSDQAKQAYDNKEITIKNLREKIGDMEDQINNKMSDIENNNLQLTELRSQLTDLVTECETLYTVYEVKREKVLDMKSSVRTDYNAGWKDTGGWGDNGAQITTNWPVDDWAASPSPIAQPTAASDSVKYRALYEFVARNSDEISFQPGDTVMVPTQQTGEPGWLAGEIRGHTGWFPESYVEPIDGIGVGGEVVAAEAIGSMGESIESKRLEGIAEVPEVIQEVAEVAPVAKIETPVDEVIEYCMANYPYQSVEQGDLSFNSGDVIAVIKKDGDWWTGKNGDLVGIFPSNYVQKYDANAPPTNIAPTVPASVAPLATIEAVQPQDSSTTQMDNEVSQINENNSVAEKFSEIMAANANIQPLKGGKKPEIASVIAPYQATSPEQLSLQRGQLIMIRKKTDSGWWEGELQAKGKKRQVGWFPASYVKVLNSSGRASGRTTPVSTTRIQQEVVIDKVIALYPYTAANPDELSFLKDDILSVTAREEPSWWRGELNGVSGLFPSNYVSPLQLTKDKPRCDAINELIQTEKIYIDDMAVVHKVFETPLRNSRIISEEDVNGIFVNWQDILKCNQNFLDDLQKRRSSASDVIGDVICAHLPLMTAYITFCSKQLESAALLQKLTETSTAFREVVKKCQGDRATKGMPLSSFLIKPMQRITRYPLLIDKILEQTPTEHSDYELLREAKSIADNFLKRLNENVRVKENQERLEWMQTFIQQTDAIVFGSCTNRLGPRKLLHFGNLVKVKSGKELIGFLLNDFFLLVQPSKCPGQFNFQKNSNIIYKVYKQPMLMLELKASKGSSDNVESGTDSNRVLKIQDKKHSLALLAHTVNECNLWVKRIESAKEIALKAASLTKTKTKPPLGATCGRLLVLVQKGTRFISAGKPHNDNIYCKVFLGDQEQQTDIAKDAINGNVPQNGAPQVPTLVWNHSMQFHIRNINDEILTIIVYEMCPFSPDEFLGRAELKLSDIYRETQSTNGPITKKLILHQVESGEVVIKLDMQMFSNNY